MPLDPLLINDVTVSIDFFEKKAMNSNDPASLVSLTKPTITGNSEITKAGINEMKNYPSNPVYEGRNGADETMKKIGNYLQDECFKCDIPNASDFEDIGKDLESFFSSYAKGMADYAKSLVSNILASNGIFSDLCQLGAMRHFLCVPDLAKILAFFSLLQAKYSMDFKIAYPSLNSLLLQIVNTVVTQAIGAMDKCVNLILTPMDCYVNAIRSLKTKLELPPKDGSENPQDSMDSVIDTMASYIKNASNHYSSFVEGVMEDYERFLRSANKGAEESKKRIFNIIFIISMINFIKTLMELSQKMENFDELCNTKAVPDFELPMAPVDFDTPTDEEARADLWGQVGGF